MISLPKAIIISGTSRNVGKTTLACNIIDYCSSENTTAIKISPHKHFDKADKNSKIIEWNDDYVILQELSSSESRDSSRMLAAGANRVYFIMVSDEFLPKAFDALLKHLDINNRIIIESAALRRFVKPKTFIITYTDNNIETKPKNLDLEQHLDFRIKFKDNKFLKDKAEIMISDLL